VAGGVADRWREEYREHYAQVRHQAFPLLTAAARADAAAVWERYLDAAANFAFTPAVIHRDLGTEHILWERETGRLPGVLDWGDAANGDPTLEFVGLYRGCGRASTQHVLASYRGAADATVWRRIAIYTWLGAFHEVLYGLVASAPEHVRQGIAAIEEQPTVLDE
jgi:aminoglycoside 2''-phosphotransferase